MVQWRCRCSGTTGHGPARLQGSASGPLRSRWSLPRSARPTAYAGGKAPYGPLGLPRKVAALPFGSRATPPSAHVSVGGAWFLVGSAATLRGSDHRERRGPHGPLHSAVGRADPLNVAGRRPLCRRRARSGSRSTRAPSPAHTASSTSHAAYPPRRGSFPRAPPATALLGPEVMSYWKA